MTSITNTADRSDGHRGGRACGVTIATAWSVACWLLAAVLDSALRYVGQPAAQSPIIDMVVMGVVAGALWGLVRRSLGLGLRAVAAGLVGLPVAYSVAYPLLFMFFHNAALGWLGNAAFLLIVTVIFCALFGMITEGPRSAGIFALMGAIAGVPFGAALEASVRFTPTDAPDILVWSIPTVCLALSIGLGTGLAGGLWRAGPERRSLQPAGDPPAGSVGREAGGGPDDPQ